MDKTGRIPDLSVNYDSVQIEVRMAHDVPRAVVIARYSGRCSRMLLWETDRDVFHPGQWLKGGIELLDISSDGRYVAYYANTSHRRVERYLAISRPPYLTALFFRPLASPGGAGCFDSEMGFRWAGFASEDTRDPGRTEPDCPFTIEEVLNYDGLRQLVRRKDASRPSVSAAVERYGEAAREMLAEPWRGLRIHPGVDERLLGRPGMSFPWGEPWRATWDHQGRMIVADSPRLLAFREGTNEPEELLDLSQMKWANVESPDWARRW